GALWFAASRGVLQHPQSSQSIHPQRKPGHQFLEQPVEDGARIFHSNRKGRPEWRSRNHHRRAKEHSARTEANVLTTTENRPQFPGSLPMLPGFFTAQGILRSVRRNGVRSACLLSCLRASTHLSRN